MTISQTTCDRCSEGDDEGNDEDNDDDDNEDIQMTRTMGLMRRRMMMK